MMSECTSGQSRWSGPPRLRRSAARYGCVAAGSHRGGNRGPAKLGNLCAGAQLSGEPGSIFRGRVAAYQDYVHFVGVSGPTASGGASLWYFRSTNRGDTWSATPLATALGIYGGGQTVAVDPSNGVVHVGYTDANGSLGAGPTLYIRSSDNGANWSTPIPIGENTAESSRQASVQITAADGHVFSCWQREPATSGGTLPPDRIGYNTSSDGGLAWGTARVGALRCQEKIVKSVVDFFDTSRYRDTLASIAVSAARTSSELALVSGLENRGPTRSAS